MSSSTPRQGAVLQCHAQRRRHPGAAGSTEPRLRICWRYSADPLPQGGINMPAAWQALGQACGSTPIFSNADVRYMAPVRVLASERSR